MAVVLVLTQALLASASNVLGGVAARRLPLTIVVAIAGPTTIVLGLIIVPLMPGSPTTAGLWIGFLAGLFGGAGLPIAYRAFAIGPAGVAGAVLTVVSTIWFTVVGVLTGDPMTPFRAIGLSLGLVAILLVTYRRPVNGQRSSLRGPFLAALAATLFSGFVIAINFAPDSDGMWPLLGARFGVTTVAMILLGMMLYRVGRRVVVGHLKGRHVVIPIAAGTADMLGNFFLVLALQAGDLILLAILAPAAPIFTAIIGRVFLREHMTRWQILGLAVASAALVLASI